MFVVKFILCHVTYKLLKISVFDRPCHMYYMKHAQVRWAGHLTRMPDDRILKQLFYGELCQGKRSVGEQRKRLKDSPKVSEGLNY